MEDVDADADEDAFPVSRRGAMPGAFAFILFAGGMMITAEERWKMRSYVVDKGILPSFFRSLVHESLTNCIAQSEGEKFWMTSEVNIAGRVCRAYATAWLI